MSIIGPFPPTLLQKAKYADRYFTKDYQIFEKLEDTCVLIKPKRTTLKARLKCPHELFLDFIAKCLCLNPAER